MFKKITKLLMPVLLTAAIVAGGYYGIYGMKYLMKDDLGIPRTFEKRKGSQIYYLGDQDKPLIYPWNLFNEDECVNVKDKIFSEIEEDVMVDFESIVKNLLKNIRDGYDVMDVFSSFMYSSSEDIYYLNNYSYKGDDGKEYFLSMAFSGNYDNVNILYYRYQPVGEQKTDKETVLLADEKIKADLDELREEVYDFLGMDFIEYMYSQRDFIENYEAEAYEEQSYLLMDKILSLVADKKPGDENLFWAYFSKFLSGDELYKVFVPAMGGTCNTLSYNNEIMIIFTMDSDSLTEFMPEVENIAKTLIFFYDVSEHSIVGFSAQY